MAYAFNGTTDKLSLANETTLRYEYTQAFSGHCWVKRSSVLTGNCVMGKAQNAPPAADQRGWAFNTESVSGQMMLSFHLVNDNSPSQHAYKIGKDPSGVITGLQPALWVPIGFTYDGSGLTSGMTLYANGIALQTHGTPVDTLGGNTILVNGTPMTIAGFDTEFWAGTAAGIVLVPAQLSAAEMAKLGDVANIYADPRSFLSTAPSVWLPLRKYGTTVNGTDLSGNGHDVSVGGGTPLVDNDPKVVFDTFSTQSFTSSTSYTHTPNCFVRGVVVLIAQDVTSSDLISGVTYGGVSMTRVTSNGFAQDTAGEPGAVYAYVLSSGIPQGAQTVAATVSSGTDAKQLWTITINSIAQVSVTASSKLEGDATNPSVVVTTPGPWVGQMMNVIYSGLDAPASLTIGGGYLQLGGGRDFGTQSALAAIADTSGGNLTSGWTAANDDAAMIAFALGLSETADQLISSHGVGMGRW